MVSRKYGNKLITSKDREGNKLKIEFRGNGNTNNSFRGAEPTVIVDHVVAGSGSSCDSWFRSSGNSVSSAHFLVWEDGRVTQYVDIRQMAWANGLSTDRIPKSKANIVKQRKINPNKYSISIEHAGFTGELTAAQLKASIELHRWIRDEVKRIYGHTIPMDRNNILGHFEVDPTRKPNCPGPKFPWNSLISGISGTKEVVKTGPSGNVLNRDDKGSEVKELQSNLIKLGMKMPKYGADGHYGQETVDAVKAFQKKHGLDVDGIAGPQVFTKIGQLIKPAPSHIGTVEILVDQLNVRTSASFDAPVDRQLYKGKVYKAYTLKNGLYNVGGPSWISAGSKYVKFTKV